MKLNKNQVEFYHEKGYLILDKLFTESEIEYLKMKVEMFEQYEKIPNIIYETNGDIRSVYAPHIDNDAFDWFYRQERLLAPVQQLVGNQVYLYQYKLNNKKAFGGDWWEWHQDFPFWHIDDGVKFPKMISAMILFQDTASVQGPLMFLPESHKMGIANFEVKLHLKNEEDNLMNSLNSDLKYTIEKKMLRKLVEDSEIVVGEGSIGTCILFHPNLFHASNSNISPLDRYSAIITYNDITNLPENKQNNRPEYICSRNFDPIFQREDKLETYHTT